MFKPIKKLVLATRFEREKAELGINLGRIEINEVVQSDYELLDRYQSFTSELLRLSLIGIGVYAFLLKDLNETFRRIADNPTTKWLSLFSISFLALAAACSLVHRYYSSDFMAYHIRYLRIRKALKDFPDEFNKTDKENALKIAQSEKGDRNVILQLCEVMIAGSSLFLGLGTLSLAASLITALFWDHPSQ